MKINYQLQTDNIIQSLQSRPRLLLHSCCGPCSSYVLEYLQKHFDITIFFYNPNIQPEAEYLRRLEGQCLLVREMCPGTEIIAPDSRGDDFTQAITGLEAEPEGGARCTACFALRLEETAKSAAKGAFDYFATTLTVSPHKDSARINKIGFSLAEKYNVNWLPSDFKKREGYKRSIELSNSYDLYRQTYCGCTFSSSSQDE